MGAQLRPDGAEVIHPSKATLPDVQAMILSRGEAWVLVVQRWLTLLRDRQYAHGSELVAGLIGSVDRNDVSDLLWAMCSAKVILRCRFDPTRDQQFFNVNGSLGGDLNYHHDAFHYAPGPNI